MSEFPKKELEALWAPWRVQYFEKEPRDRNFLEAAAQASDDAARARAGAFACRDKGAGV